MESYQIFYLSCVKRIAVLFALVPIVALAQKQDCTPHPGTTKVCDSIRNIYHADAYYLAMIAVSRPTSQWHDSLYYPEELIWNFTNAMCALYNDLPDSLADFRSYHYYYPNLTHIPEAYLHPDSSAIVTINLPLRAIDTLNKDLTQSGNARLDSLMIACGTTFISRKIIPGVYVELKYRFPPRLNRSYIQNRLLKVDPIIVMRPSPYYDLYLPIIITEGPDTYEISLVETGPCMPPELPCHFIRRTFIYQQEWNVRYLKFERGIVPWPVGIKE